jgi:PAS domain S-box-containing protein
MFVALCLSVLVIAILAVLLLRARRDRAQEIARAESANAQAASLAQRLHEDTERRRNVESMAGIGSYQVDLRTGALTVSEGFLALHQLTPETLPRTAREYIETFVRDPEQYAEAIANTARVERGERVEGSRQICLPDGTNRWMRYVTETTRDEHGTPLTIMGVMRNDTEEKQAALDLIALTTQLRETQRIAHIGHFYWDLASDKLTVSENYYDIFGLPEGRRFHTMREWLDGMCHPDDKPASVAAQQVVEAGKAYQVMRRTIAADGSIRHLEINGEPIRSREGRLTAYRGTVKDVTEQATRLKQLADSETRYRLISAHMQDVVSLHTPDGLTTFCTPSIERLLGYAVDKIVGTSPIPNIHPEEQPQILQVMRRFREGQRNQMRATYRFRHRNGQYVWLETRIVPVLNEEGTLLHFQATTVDITEKHEATQALLQSEARFRHLTELSSDWYWEQDAQHRFTFLSRQRAVVDQTTREAAIGKTRWELDPYALTVEQWAEHREMLDARQPFRNLIMRVVNPSDLDGEPLGYISISGEPLFDDAGTFIGYRGVGVDVTKRHLAELALARRTSELAIANMRLTDEAARRRELEAKMLMSIEMELAQVGLELHDDLGQNLTGVALMVKALENRIPKDAPDSLEEVKRISQLVNRAIRHTRMISHGLSPYIWGDTGLVSALTQLSEDINGIGTVTCRANLQPDVSIEGEVVVRSLYRIAQEAVNNALKHSGATRIGISLKSIRGQIQLVISDNGDCNPVLATSLGEGRGLNSIRHRVRTISGSLVIRQAKPHGTSVRVTWQPDARTAIPAFLSQQLSQIEQQATGRRSSQQSFTHNKAEPTAPKNDALPRKET